MRKKIFICLLGFTTGIGIFISFESINPLIIIISAIILALLSLLIDKDLYVFPLAIGLGFFLSFSNFNKQVLIEDQNLSAEITILEKRKTDKNYRYVVSFNSNEIRDKSIVFSDYDLKIGDILDVKADINIPNKNTNPNLFNYRNYLLSKKITSNLEIKKIYEKSRKKSLFLDARNFFYNYIHKVFEENLTYDSSNFVVSLILGENLIDSDDIRDLGLAHLLAVSGLHMDILMTFILYICKKFRINYKLGYGFSLLLSLFYGYLISFPYSVIRVLIVSSISFLAFALDEPFDRLKALGIAALSILIANPFAILNAGFVLTFVASSGVYLIYPKIKVFLKEGLISESIGFTLAIQISLLPFTIFYYGKINLLSILANFLIIPIFTLAMYIIFFIVFTYPIFKILEKPIFIILDYLMVSILNLTSNLARLKFLTIEFAHPHILSVVYLYLLILVVFYIKRPNKKTLKSFYSISLLIVALGLARDYRHKETSFSMIDIGQGDAFLLNDGGDYYLIDVGGPKYDDYDSGEKILVPYLKSLGINNIKAVFISHEDMDHSGNLEILNENFNVENVISGPYNINGLKKYNAKALKLNDKIMLKNGSVRCVFEGKEGEENAESLGLLFDIKGTRILCLGDLPSEYENQLKIKADILKLSHHGSASSTSELFLENVEPKLVLISAGRNNRYGHPSREVIMRLKGIRVYNSQDCGMVKVSFDDGIRIEKFLKGGFFRWSIKNIWIPYLMIKIRECTFLIQRKNF